MAFKPLKQGSRVAVVATGSSVDPLRLERGAKELERAGYSPVVFGEPTKHFGDSSLPFFGSEVLAQRVESFHAAVRDAQVSAIFSARGGYGTLEMLPFIDWTLLQENPKILVGFSDLTPLLVNCSERSGFLSVHGPAVAVEWALASSSADAQVSVDTTVEFLSGLRPAISYPLEVIKAEGLSKNCFEGSLIVGNLTMLTTLLGTPWDVSYNGKILVIEEVSEAPYRVHRLLMQLLLAGKLSSLKGLIFAQFVNCKGPHEDKDESIKCLSSDYLRNVICEFVRDKLRDRWYPVLYGLASGHALQNVPLPLGCRGRIIAGSSGVMLDIDSPFSSYAPNTK